MCRKVGVGGANEILKGKTNLGLKTQDDGEGERFHKEKRGVPRSRGGEKEAKANQPRSTITSGKSGWVGGVVPIFGQFGQKRSERVKKKSGEAQENLIKAGKPF